MGNRRHTQLLIMGDFNLPHLHRRADHPTYTLDHKFRELLAIFPLYNHVFDYTRKRGLEQPSILDLVLTSEATAIEMIDYQAPLGRSDHLVLAFEYVCSARRLSADTKLIRRVDNLALREALREFDNHNVDYSDPESHCISLTNYLNTKISENARFVPRKEKNNFHFIIRSRTKKWITLRNRAWIVHKSSDTVTSWLYFRKVRNKVTTLIREDKQCHQLYLVRKMEGNPKLLYRIVNDQAKVKPGVSPVNTTDGLTESVQETADALASFYSQVFNPKGAPLDLGQPASVTINLLSDITINSVIVQQQLLRLNIRKSPGADGITPAILKVCHQQLCHPLSELFNHSLSEGTVPTEWKSGIISPIYKGGCRSELANYRPVTLLPVMSKVMERIVTENIVRHVETQKLLSVAQHGFRKAYSCLSNLLTTLDDWTKALDDGSCIHACYLDMSKAFDRVDHSLLLRKLRELGITGNLLAWLESYLSDRNARVRIDGTLSRIIKASSGVPQGSVLGPMLFLIYVNDLPKLVVCKMVLFADDIKLWARIESTRDCLLLQRDLDALHDWSARNKMLFNFRKCKMLQLGRKFQFSYRLGPETLEWTTSEKDLGIWICGSLKNSSQCEAVYKRASGLLGLLRRIFGRFSPGTLPMILNTYIHPVMEYASQAWTPWLRKDVLLLDKIYHRATKLITGFQRLPYEERLTRLKLVTLSHRRTRGDLILTYRILNSPNHPLRHLFQQRSARTTRGHAAALSIPHSRLDCRRHFYAVRVCFLWNSLPENIVTATCESIFKRKLDVYMLQNASIAPAY